MCVDCLERGSPVRRILLATSIALFFSDSAVLATQTFFVDAANVDDPAADGSAVHPFPLVQSAIGVSQDGDFVLVLPGTYFENLDFLGKDIAVVSRDGPAVTILDGGNFVSVVTMALGETRAARLSGFTIQHGLGTGNGSYNIGGGIRIYQASPTIRGNWIINNEAHFGGGIDCEESNPLIIDNLIANNFVGDNHLRHLTGDGAGISLYNSSAEIYNNRIMNNIAVRQGGGIAIQDSNGTGLYPVIVPIVNNLIAGNSVNERAGGALAFFFRGTVDLRGCTLAANLAPSADGIFMTGAAATINAANSIVYYNDASSALEVFITASSTMNIAYSDVEGGVAGIAVLGGATLNDIGGNIAAPPLFADDENGNYALGVCSPCVDAGDPAFGGTGEVDAAGAARVFAGRVDIGAYEAIYGDANENGVPDACECPADLDHDGAVGLQDLANLLANFGTAGPGLSGDIDADGDVDLQDLAFLLAVFGTTC